MCCNRVDKYKTVQDHLPSTKRAKQDIGFKIFVVVTVVLASIIAVVGILALCASKGFIPSGMGSIEKLTLIGEVNSYVMIGAGIGLFVLGILAWGCHLNKESKSQFKADSKRLV